MVNKVGLLRHNIGRFKRIICLYSAIYLPHSDVILMLKDLEGKFNKQRKYRIISI